jgi:hypothetical protein
VVSITDFQPYKYENLARRGSVHDGGYVIPSDLTANLLIAFGLGYDWKFELDLIRCKQVDRFIVFDHTVNVSKLLKNLLLRKPNLNSYMYLSIVLFRYLRDFVFLKYVHVRKKICAVGEPGNNNWLSLSQVFEVYVLDSKSRIFLKIDIEGYEYEIVDQILNFSRQIKVLVIEFHDIHSRDKEFVNSLDKLKSKFALVHSHINNYGKVDMKGIPNICEFTFINLDLFDATSKVNKLPINGLDSPSAPRRRDFETNFDSSRGIR